MALKYSSFTLPLGANIPDFALQNFGTDGASQLDQRELGQFPVVVIFMCNHCPYVHHVMPSIAALSEKYLGNVRFVGINSNDTHAYPEDRPERMQPFLEKYQATMAYLYDETQEVAKAFGAECTPDTFVFDASGVLVYRGAIDTTRVGNENSDGMLLQSVLDSVMHPNTRSHITEQPSMGCGIKWK